MPLIQEQEKTQLKQAVKTAQERKHAALKALRQSGFRVPDHASLVELLHDTHHPHP